LGRAGGAIEVIRFHRVVVNFLNEKRNQASHPSPSPTRRG
jgi:hypothetical protein